MNIPPITVFERIDMKQIFLLWTTIVLFACVVPLSAADDVDGSTPDALAGFQVLSAEALDQGALLLFDGLTFFGWQASADIATRPQNIADPKIQIENGTLHVKTEIPLRLRTSVCWKNDSRGNEGIRIVVQGKIPSNAVQYRLLDASGKELAVQPASGQARQTIVFKMNDNNTVGTQFEIALTKDASFNSIVLFAPGNVSSFSKKALDAWKPVAADAKVQANDNGFTLSGKGQLETKESFDDFLCRFEFKSLVDPTRRAETFCNSGFFFRCIPDSKLDGYECQINNVPNEADRKKFLGNDTGSIFRRAAARRVTDQDNQWTYMAVQAAGSAFRTWVNGIPTVVWQDTRKPDNNPRRGLKLQPGTIQLQGHDPWTAIEFRGFSLFR